VEKHAESRTGYSVLSGSIEGVVIADELQELHTFVVGNHHTQQARNFEHIAEAQKATSDAGSMVEAPVLVVARCSLVEVHISLQPFHLPSERSLVQRPLSAED